MYIVVQTRECLYSTEHIRGYIFNGNLKMHKIVINYSVSVTCVFVLFCFLYQLSCQFLGQHMIYCES